MHSEAFRPKLPLDPFTDLEQPWSVNFDSLPQPFRQVILVLGGRSLLFLATVYLLMRSLYRAFI